MHAAARCWLVALLGVMPAPAAAQDSGGGDEPGATDRHAAAVQTAASPRYFLEAIEVEGNTRTQRRVIRRYVPLRRGDVIDMDSPQIEAIRWRLLGTGWFSDVRLRIARGSRRGWVVLRVKVEERNTVVFRNLTFGVAEGLGGSRDERADIIPYFGAQVVETNLLGIGIGLSFEALLSQPQQGLRLAFTDPAAFGSPNLLSASLFFNNAREFFGNESVSVSIACPEPPEECPDEVMARNAVVFYRRGGGSIGTGRDLGASTRYTLDWQGEVVQVGVMPTAASEVRGTEVRPIDFAIENGRSYVSLLRVGIEYDRRDDPVLTTRGVLVRFLGDGASRLFASDYEFLRLQSTLRWWVPMPGPRTHYLRFGIFGGVVFGDAPFFYDFHVADLTDLIPSRNLQMSLDRRAPPNLLGTSVDVMRSEEVAGRVDFEYGHHLFRGRGGLRAVTAYANVGLYALADSRDLRVAVPGFDGFSRLPIDLTFDVGLRLDTTVGVFQFGFSNLLGFIEL